METMIMTTTMTTIALPGTIKLKGATTVLVPHGAKLPPPLPPPSLVPPICPQLFRLVGL